MKRTTPILLLGLLLSFSVSAETIFVEAESFEKHGGWKLDTQFIEIMGSPYLMAHGLGKKVDDATTEIKIDKAGEYHVMARTKDWVAHWGAEGAPGKFEIHVDGKSVGVFGDKGKDWHWQKGAKVTLSEGKHRLALKDLTGFNGRCDALILTTEAGYQPSNGNEPLAVWRKRLLGHPDEPEDAGDFDLVIVGGGYAGMGAAISAARMGVKVALIQNRGVLGGNGSSEIRVWAMGGTRRGKYPHLGGIVEEFMDKAKMSPGTYEEFGDDLKEKVVRKEDKIALFLNTHAYKVETKGNEITSVTALDTRTGRELVFKGALFADCTGHGTIGYLAGANHTMQEKGHLGMSNMWAWEEADEDVDFPKADWALKLTMDDFPYPVRGHGQWFWESGFDLHPLHDLEKTRDWNLRAVFGAFNTMKNRDGRAEHLKANLTWVAYIGGTRESRQLLGDVVLTRDDIVGKKEFDDGSVPTTWSIDLHYPREQYKSHPEDPFISKAVHDRKVDRKNGYPVPYRCFYSRNIENLFMAGRNVSVTHEALGTVRVMKTGGMMGEVVGKAASICVANSCKPRDVYHNYLVNLKELMSLSGVTRRDSVKGDFYVAKDAIVLGTPGIKYLDPALMEGLVIDDSQAILVGKWTGGEGLKDYIGTQYSYHGKGGNGSATYQWTVKETGNYEVLLSHQPHKNRSSNTKVQVHAADGVKDHVVNQRDKPPLPLGLVSLGDHYFRKGQKASVVILTDGADGTVHADAVQILKK
ncbi:FAD-dependent oxidoreductase [Verrucomicrobia bacterium]|nr:FAD-dependent oxidoreductase [Verrucomicrobiota bacterium]